MRGFLSIDTTKVADDSMLLGEFRQMTESDGLSRRLAIAELARRHGRSVNEVYRAIERAKRGPT
jgi:hypothetical protein